MSSARLRPNHYLGLRLLVKQIPMLRILCDVVNCVIRVITGHLATGSRRCHGNVSSCHVIIWILLALRRTTWRRGFQGRHCVSACIVSRTTALIRRHSVGKRKIRIRTGQTPLFGNKRNYRLTSTSQGSFITFCLTSSNCSTSES